MIELGYNQRANSALAAYLRGGRLPHAILLEGPRGSGKVTFARRVAQGALCTAEPEERPCGVCRDCVKVEKEIHPDVLLYAGEGGSRSFHVEAVREIRQEAYVRPNEGARKVLILRDVHQMTVQAQNALLKIIEEPPGTVLFLLTCENKAALLETILSRVAAIRLEVPTVEQCAQVLATLRPEAEEPARLEAARRARGVVGQALELMEPSEEERDDQGEELLELLCLGSELEAMSRLAPLERDREGFVRLVGAMEAALRELMVEEARGNGQSKRLLQRLSPLQRMQILGIMEEMARACRSNVSGVLLTTNLCAKIRLVLAG